MRSVPLFGSGVYGKSAVVTRQRRLNCYYELRPDGDKGVKVVIYGTPGLVLVATLSGVPNTPVRAMLGNDLTLWLVSSNNFQVYNKGYALLFSALVGSLSGQASMATNPNSSQIVVVDGSNGWVYQPLSGTFALLPGASWFVPGAQTVVNTGGYFVTEIPGTNQFAVSNINDATAGSALSFGAAAAYADLMQAVDTLDGNLLLFTTQHMEFWQNVGNPAPGQPFSPIQSATNRWGLAATFSRANVDNSLVFLGETIQGVRRVVQVRGYVATAVSDEIDWIINQDGWVYADAVALSYQKDTHPFYQLTFPTMGRTFVLDCSTGIWNEAQTGLSQNYAARHQGNLSTYFAGDTVVSDYQNANLYRFSDQSYTDNGVTIPFEVVTKHQFKSGNRFRVPQLYLDMETGVGLAGIPGQPGVMPVVSLECSKDNGRSWLLPRAIPLGQIANFIDRVTARRFGKGRVFTWRIRITDPVKRVIVDGAIRIKGLKETA